MQPQYRTGAFMMKVLSFITVLLLSALPSDAQVEGDKTFLFTFENNGKNAIDMFYVDSPLIEHKMGVIKPDGDLTHRVMTGQTFAARVHNEDFRAMLQIDHIDKEEDAPPGPEFKITFINIMGEATEGTDSFDVKYEGKTVGTSKVGQPHTEGVFDHTRMTIVHGDENKFSVRAIRAPKDEL